MDTGISLNYIRRQIEAVNPGNLSDMRQYAHVKYTSEQEQAILMEKYGRNIFLRFLYRNKDAIKKIPFLGRSFLYIKNKAVKKTVEKRKKQPVSIAGIINLTDEEYIRQLYILFLNREPDEPGFKNMMNVCCGPADHETLAYIIYKSREFNRRVKFIEAGRCRRKYLNYRIKLMVKKNRDV